MPEEIGDHKLEGEFLRIAKEVNYMVKQLNLFSMEVTRVAREVGSEGKLGGQAKVKGVGGVWKDLTDSVNHMAGNLTNQVRNIAEVTTAIARGNLSKKITVDVKGEMLELKNTINTMVDQLNSFGSEVTRVALEVGTEGRLGGSGNSKRCWWCMEKSYGLCKPNGWKFNSPSAEHRRGDNRRGQGRLVQKNYC